MQRRELQKGMYGARKDEKPATWLACTLRKENLFSYCLFLQDGFSSLAGVDTPFCLQGCSLQESCALKSCSDTATTGIKSHLLARQRSLCTAVRVAWHLEQGGME